MATALIGLASAATNAAGPSGADAAASPLLYPAWILAAGGVLLLVVIAAILGTIAGKVGRKAEPDKKEFTRMLCNQLWKHTNRVTDLYAQLLRNMPADVTALRVQVRTLREHLSAPIHFVDQMRAHSSWPSYELLAAFTEWAGKLKSMESQLADLQHTVTYPVVKEPVDKFRDQMLIHHYQTEQAVQLRAINDLRDYAFAVCKAANKHLDSGSHGFFHKAEEGHVHCACCGCAEEHPAPIRAEIKIEIPPAPPKPPAPPPPPPAGQHCFCVVAQPCHCQRGCACGCQCPRPAPEPAKTPA